mgnify:CR=1 FL=1
MVFLELLQSLKSELTLGYLDDVAMGGDAKTVLEDFLHLEATAKEFGLELNRSKCEVVGHTEETRRLFATQNIILPETSMSSVILLGAPLSAGQHLDDVLTVKRKELELLTYRLTLMPAHDSLYLLRNVLTAPRLMYLLRTAPCTDSPELPRYDAVLRESLSSVLNVDLDDKRWTQASLPVRWGGLGVRGVGFAGTVCLPGFSRKHHGAHFHPPTRTSPRHTHTGQRNRRRHVCLVEAGIHADVNSAATRTACTACMGRSVLPSEGRRAARHSGRPT